MKWINIKDELPALGEEVLVAARDRKTGEHEVFGDVCRYEDFLYVDQECDRTEKWATFYEINEGVGDFERDYEVTHFMRFPAPPTQEQAE